MHDTGTANQGKGSSSPCHVVVSRE